MGRQAKLKRQRKQAVQSEPKLEINGAGDRESSAPSANTEPTDTASSHTQPMTRDFLNKMERQGYSLRADNRAPEIPN